MGRGTSTIGEWKADSHLETTRNSLRACQVDTRVGDRTGLPLADRAPHRTSLTRPTTKMLAEASAAAQRWWRAISSIQNSYALLVALPGARIIQLEDLFLENLRTEYPNSTRKQRLDLINGTVRYALGGCPIIAPEGLFHLLGPLRPGPALLSILQNNEAEISILLDHYGVPDADKVVESARRRIREGQDPWPAKEFPDGGPLTFGQLRERERPPRKRKK